MSLSEECIYLDWNATTPLFPEVKQAILDTIDCFGNPSSSHVYGLKAKEKVDKARQQVATLLNCKPCEVHFVSCGTEADNWAIWGVTMAARRKNPNQLPHVITSAVEHPAILEYLEQLASLQLIEYTIVSVDIEGFVNLHDIESAIKPSTCLITVMHANNEIGTIQPIKEIVRLANKHNQGTIRVHTDAAQSCGKISVDVHSALGGVDLCTLVGHKMGAPKGIAVLYIRQGVEIERLLCGGGQEQGKRAGTENVLLITAMGAAAEVVTEELETIAAQMAECRDILKDHLVSVFRKENGRLCVVNGPADDSKRLPNTLSISIEGASTAGLFREQRLSQVAASVGAACHSSVDVEQESESFSSVLKAIGLHPELARGTVRLSVGRSTTEEDVHKAVKPLIDLHNY